MSGISSQGLLRLTVFGRKLVDVDDVAVLELRFEVLERLPLPGWTLSDVPLRGLDYACGLRRGSQGLHAEDAGHAEFGAEVGSASQQKAVVRDVQRLRIEAPVRHGNNPRAGAPSCQEPEGTCSKQLDHPWAHQRDPQRSTNQKSIPHT